jgi:hypothetical protein
MNYDRFNIHIAAGPNGMSYAQADNYCTSIGMRLPNQYESYCMCKGYPTITYPSIHPLWYNWYQCDTYYGQPCTPAAYRRQNCYGGMTPDSSVPVLYLCVL